MTDIFQSKCKRKSFVDLMGLPKLFPIGNLSHQKNVADITQGMASSAG
jgi:hypothetical protein